ncbi:NAD(P)/FAD-dependent oxidoreductase [Kamptonema cortianum]|uniref:NAD(P)/FAD-dependent oxidoreductase n=1 Tax=Geitlerinema calcuttense NRMC-F 0142 TaxID=2922238 RepID=A0ABT7LWZ9_9CYAN|nr:NAD(P)/FAD-dependent oxidoreductase [Geitlerinema calcuttense]MDK3162083.1 NAD(P)/FAD-dependent oxidoreductase [Kamptonema cortianum]MDL5056546.1 NAD(P)/FAD-dependent oxidoreductase [Geitlerinema calcuttense NRMC-F 0142]
MNQQSSDRVVIIGGGFGGLYAAKALGKAPVQVTLVDKRNFHLFQPLLYQVATGSVSPADISSPLRGILSPYKNITVLLDEAVDLDPQAQQVVLQSQTIPYDTLVVATGVSHHYFGNEQWRNLAPGLKTVEDALEMRRRIFMAFEAAEKETDPEKQKAWLTFVIVGGGPTGVELAGAIAELAFSILKHDFRNIDTRATRILLLEGMDRVLPPYAEELSANAQQALADLGVEILTKALVTKIESDRVTYRLGDRTEEVTAKTLLWAAGVKASSMGEILHQSTGVERDRVGRVMVEPDLSIPGYPNIFVIGDLAHFAHQDDKPLPGVAPVAMQEGDYVAKLIKKRLKGETLPPFRYTDYGSLAVIGKHAAVVDLGFIQFTGFLAWFIWVFAHIYFLIEFDNKLVVMIQWAWKYFTRKSGARLITGEESLLRVKVDEQGEYYTPETNKNQLKV